MFGFIIWPIAIIGIIIFLISRRRQKSGMHVVNDKNWYFQIAFSKEDAVSQFFYLLSFSFFGVTLFALNRDLGDFVSWQTIILITSLVGLFGSYYFRALFILPASIFGLTSWWSIKMIEWSEGKNIKEVAVFSGLMLLFIVLYLIGRIHEKEIKFKRFSLIYTIIGLVSVTGSLFFLSTREGLNQLAGMTKGDSFFNSWQITLSLMIVVIVLFLAKYYATNKKLISFPEISALAFLSFLFIGLLIIPEQSIFEVNGGRNYYYNKEFTSTGVIWAFFLNILIFLEVLGVIFSGYLKKEKWIINLGVIFMFLLILVKYFDWFFTFFDKSIFFISAGIILFMVGWFMEKGRKYMLSEIKKTEEPINQ